MLARLDCVAVCTDKKGQLLVLLLPTYRGKHGKRCRDPRGSEGTPGTKGEKGVWKKRKKEGEVSGVVAPRTTYTRKERGKGERTGKHAIPTPLRHRRLVYSRGKINPLPSIAFHTQHENLFGE